MAKYDALEAYLRALHDNSVRLTFDDINKILASKLPRSAYKHPAFWSNTAVGSTHVWADAWQRAGWHTAGHDLEQQFVDFRRSKAPMSEMEQDGKQHAEEVSENKKFCEIWTGARWEAWPVSAAHAHREEAIVRCPECHGPVVLMKGSYNGRNEAHFEHRPTHSGCPLAYKGFCGKPSQHPNAVKTPLASNQLAFTDYMSDDAAAEIIGSNINATEKERLMLARVGQGLFRKQLLSRWGSCSVLGCGPDTALIASHIVPWRACANNGERLDVNNGLLLSPNLDKLFDRGLISFADDSTLLVSVTLDREDAIALGLRPSMQLRTMPPGILKYLARHRDGKHWCRLT